MASVGSNGCFTTQEITSYKSAYSGNTSYPQRVNFNANDGATTKGIYGNSNTVQPKSYSVRYIIRAK